MNTGQTFFINTHLNQNFISPPERTHTDKTHDICLSVSSFTHNTGNKSFSEEKGHKVKGQLQWAMLFSFCQRYLFLVFIEIVQRLRVFLTDLGTIWRAKKSHFDCMNSLEIALVLLKKNKKIQL